MEEKLKKIRLSLKKTQKEMSSLLGLGEITWQNYERGISKPKIETLKKLAKLGFNINWITSINNDNENMLNENVEENSLNQSIQNISLNKSLIFNTLLNGMRNIYHNANLSRLGNNYIENKAFEMTINIISVAKDNNDAIKMIQLLLNQEKQDVASKF